MKSETETMKKFFLAVAGLAAFGAATSAVAADLPARTYTKAPPMIAAIYDWSGFYIGANGGGASSRNCWDINNSFGAVVAPAVREGCHDATGAVAGGQIGYRWQSASWVFGVEAQGDWANLKGSNTSQFFLPPAPLNQSKIGALGLFTGQVGYAWSNVLWYLKGGAAATDTNYKGFIGGVLVDQASETRWGGAVGTGLEVGFAPNWSVGVEYDHLFMGNRNITFTAPAGGATRTDNIHQDVDMGSVRVNYRWGGPVVGKY
jgi:outer membrane immunogenic protein